MASVDYRPARLRIQSPSNGLLHKILTSPLSSVVGLSLITIVAFINAADISIDKDKVGLDAQVMLKLVGIGFAGIYGGIGFITDRRVRDLAQSFPVFWVVIIIAMYFVSSAFSMDPKISLASTISLVAILLLMLRALVQIGIMPVINAIFVGMGLFNIFSWIVFFVWPEIGVLKEPLPDGKFAHRMSGLAHSNVLGQYSGLTVVLGTILVFTYKRRSAMRIGLIAIALAALIASLSRTSLAATIVGLAVAYRRVFFKPEYLQRYVIAGMVGVFALMVVSTQVDLGAKIKEKMTIVSKSGDADELTSATGRSEIWAYAIRLISERPLTGYEAATTKHYLARYSSYTHNMILNVAFSTGIIGGFACLVMVLGRIRAMFSISHPLADGILAFIIVNGFFENVIFAVLAGMPTMLWIMSLSWPLLKDDPLVDSTTGELKDGALPEIRRRFAR
jgi:O-antigen ligase